MKKFTKVIEIYKIGSILVSELIKTTDMNTELIEAYNRKMARVKKQIETLNLYEFDVKQNIEAIKIYRNRIRSHQGEVKSLCHAIKN